MTGPPRVRFEPRGIEIEGGLLWLDATVPKPLAVITHAHADHVGRHRVAYATPETAALVAQRTGPGTVFRTLRYGESERVGDLELTLLPAGHILGSAMVHLQGPGGSLLYSGDVRLDGGVTCPPARPRMADVLILESTFGRPDRRLPPPEESRALLVRFATEALDGGLTPVFLAYALGKAQEVLAILTRAGVPVAAHGSVWNLCRTYREAGIRFPGARRLSRNGARRCALVVPPRHLFAAQVQRSGPLRVAAVTGWAESTRATNIDAVIPLSDHSDFDGLLELAERVQPKRIHTLHGYAEELAEALRERGYDAQPVEGHAGPTDDEQGAPGMWSQLDPPNPRPEQAPPDSPNPSGPER